jgi:Holliday junction resolvasome RuvABC endonuclease subunit
MHVMTIDPGMHSMGWAYWSRKKWDSNSVVPSACGLIKAVHKNADAPWWERVQEQCRRVGEMMTTASPWTVYCEMPVFFSGSAMGMAAAQTDALQKLSFMVGSLAQVVAERKGIFYPVSVREWKGQMSKEVVQARVTKALGASVVAEMNIQKDTYDAVGLGLAVRRLL